MISVERAPAYATIQDEGRRSYLSSGVPRAGAMDLACSRTLNALLGNPSNSAVVECALTGGVFNFTTRCTFAFGGAAAAATLDDQSIEPYRVYLATPGSMLTIATITVMRFLYIAFGGGIGMPIAMGSRSTYLPGAFGGLDGRRLKNGDSLPLVALPAKQHHVMDALPATLRADYSGDAIRFVPIDGSPSLSTAWTVSPTSDRTGYRLSGQPTNEGASITSTGVCPGTIQLPPGGEPIVLMADAPTVGGYRIVGAVASADLGRLAQKLPGATISLQPVSVEVAQRLAQRDAERIQSVIDWALG